MESGMKKWLPPWTSGGKPSEENNSTLVNSAPRPSFKNGENLRKKNTVNGETKNPPGKINQDVLGISLRFFCEIGQKVVWHQFESIWDLLRCNWGYTCALDCDLVRFWLRFTNHELHETTMSTSSQSPASEHCFWRTPWNVGRQYLIY